jgi:mono/diheme cytochrome c family protein
MARYWKVAGIFTLAGMVGVILGCGSQPTAPSNERPAQPQGRLERGRYLVEGVMACFACHSDVDWESPGGPPLPGKIGAGALFPDEEVPFKLYAPNITPDRETGIGAWSDEDIDRALREGISRDGRRLFPVMPYVNYLEISDEDMAAVIAYLRSIEPIRNQVPKTEIPDPIKKTLPPYQTITRPVPGPDESNPVKRGEYLVKLADCITCHTPVDQQGRPIRELAFAGGRILKGPWGEVASANITPDASGISYYDEALFLHVMRTGSVKARGLNSVMLWGYYRHLTDNDLKAMFAYLKTLAPVPHRVDNTEPPTPCKRCGFKHGLGASNG